jgi:hypothetical protein
MQGQIIQANLKKFCQDDSSVPLDAVTRQFSRHLAVVCPAVCESSRLGPASAIDHVETVQKPWAYRITCLTNKLPHSLFDGLVENQLIFDVTCESIIMQCAIK